MSAAHNPKLRRALRTWEPAVIQLNTRRAGGPSMALIALAAACSGSVEERGLSAESGGTGGGAAVGAVDGSLGAAGRASSGGTLGVDSSLGTGGTGSSYVDAGLGGSSGTAGAGGTSGTSGTGGNLGTGGVCPRMPPLCDFEPNCLNPHSPSVERVPRSPVDAGTGPRDGPLDGALVPPMFTVSAKLCEDAGVAPDPSYLAFDVRNQWTSSMPAVALLSGVACGGVPLGQIAVATPVGVPYGTYVTHCIRAPRELGTILTLVPIGATEIRRPRFVSGCECPRVLTPTSNICAIEVPGGGSACETEP
jgi:hypothetical protein